MFYETLKWNDRHTAGIVGSIIALSHLINSRSRDTGSTGYVGEAMSAAEADLRVLPYHNLCTEMASNLLAASLGFRHQENQT